ncbi:MAG TPA: hypothetical protein VGG03_25685 [Thermoanaerobaculia bacterium]
MERLRDSAGREPDSRFYFGALVSATRSVTLVLQADLRSRFEAQFDRWWNEAKKKIGPSPIDFDTLRDTRNVLQKQGNKLPLITVVETFETGPIAWLTVTFDPSRGVEGIQQAEVAPRITVSQARRQGVGATSAIFTAAIRAAIAGSSSPASSTRTYSLSESLDSVSFDALISGFASHLRELDALLTEAEQAFPIQSVWHRP